MALKTKAASQRRRTFDAARRRALARLRKGLEGTLDYPETGFNFVLTRDEMKSLDMVGVIQKLRSLAEKFAEAQSKSMFETISAAAEAVGNVRKGVGELTAEAFLSMLQKMEMDFDERTGQPR